MSPKLHRSAIVTSSGAQLICRNDERSRIIMSVSRTKEPIFIPKFDFARNFQKKLDGWTDFSTGDCGPF